MARRGLVPSYYDPNLDPRQQLARSAQAGYEAQNLASVNQAMGQANEGRRALLATAIQQETAKQLADADREARTNEANANRDVQRQGLGVQEKLGMGNLDVQKQGLTQQGELGRAGLALQEKLGTGDQGIRRDELAQRGEMGKANLGLQEKLGTGNLDVRRQEIAQQGELGKGNLALQEKLGTGNLALQEKLGTGNLDVRRQEVAQQGELGKGNLALQEKLGMGNLGLQERLPGIQAEAQKGVIGAEASAREKLLGVQHQQNLALKKEDLNAALAKAEMDILNQPSALTEIAKGLAAKTGNLADAIGLVDMAEQGRTQDALNAIRAARQRLGLADQPGAAGSAAGPAVANPGDRHSAARESLVAAGNKIRQKEFAASHQQGDQETANNLVAGATDAIHNAEQYNGGGINRQMPGIFQGQMAYRFRKSEPFEQWIRDAAAMHLASGARPEALPKLIADMAAKAFEANGLPGGVHMAQRSMPEDIEYAMRTNWRSQPWFQQAVREGMNKQ